MTIADIALLSLKSIYFILPALLANCTPVLVRKIPFLNFPIDFNRTLAGRPIFGSHKTFRGFFFGILVAIIISAAQKYLHNFIPSFSIINYNTINILLFGFLAGFGTLLGDAIESFIKRRLNHKPGQRFFPWDQIDFFIGFLLLTSIIFTPPYQVIIILIIAIPLIHILFNHLWYWLGLEESKW